MPIGTILRHHLEPSRVTDVKKPKKTRGPGQSREVRRPLVPCQREWSPWTAIRQYQQTSGPIIPLLQLYPANILKFVQRQEYTAFHCRTGHSSKWWKTWMPSRQCWVDKLQCVCSWSPTPPWTQGRSSRTDNGMIVKVCFFFPELQSSEVPLGFKKKKK